MRSIGLTAVLACLTAGALAQGSGPLGDLTKPQEGRSRRESSSFRMGRSGNYDRNSPFTGDLLEHSNHDNFRVGPGETHTLMDVKGSGVVTHIWVTFLGPEPQDWAKQGSATHQDMLLRIYWDGDPKPAVEAPVGDFFANCFGKRSPVVSLPVMVEDGDSYNCFWQMPFRKSARIEIVNQSDKPVNLLYYNIDWIEKPVAKDAPYFYAQYRQEYPAIKGKDYVVLETKGKGHYVGTVLAVRSRSPMWFGEGDEKIYIDEEAKPSLWGTGTEDYFLSAWGLQTTSTPYSGTPYFDQWGIVGGHTSAYRWHISDPIVFQKGIKVTMEHFGWISADENPEGKTNSWNEREDDYSSVAFWYQTGRSTFDERAPKMRTLPNLERITVFARDGSLASSQAGEQQQLSLYPGPQMLFTMKGTGDWVEIPFEVKNKEPLRLLLNMTTSYDFGKFQAFLTTDGLSPADGWKIGPVMDFYSEKILNREFHLLDFWPDPGLYTLKLKCVGKNSLSAGHFLGIESLRLRERRPRVKEYGFDKDLDWRSNPKLYQ